MSAFVMKWGTGGIVITNKKGHERMAKEIFGGNPWDHFPQKKTMDIGRPL